MKKIFSVVIVFTLFFSCLNCNSQEINEQSKVNIGLGMGINYGGFGGRLSFLPEKHIAIYGALGYNILGAGYNVGAIARLIPDKRFCPTIGAMYGYNAVIKIINADEYSKTYYGPSFSLGFELKSKNRPKNFWNFELIIPVRSKEYQDDIDYIKNSPVIDLKTEPSPVMISVGYHFGF